jgi:RNA polymerase sigma factor (sigma-70 family)
MRQGDSAAKEILLERYWSRLARWARGRLPAGARGLYETADLVQETMISALERLEDFEPDHDGALLAYFRMSILNRIRSLARRSARREEAVDPGAEIPTREPSPLENVIGRDAIEIYDRALRRLRPLDRDAIHLKVELDLPYEQITTLLGKPTVAAAHTAVSRALLRLAREMNRDA